MRILFDQGTPAPLREILRPHAVETAAERNWSAISNGDLLRLTEQSGFDVFITTDQQLRYQQNLSGRKLGIVVLMTTSWPKIRQRIPDIISAIAQAAGGGYVEVPI